MNDLLGLMLSDSKPYVGTVYGLSPYWKFYADGFVKHLRKHDLDPKFHHRVYDSMSVFSNQDERYKDCIDYVDKYVDFEDIQLVVELGAGTGKQMVMLKNRFPHLTVWVFDIPPFLYVTEKTLQRISTTFDYVGYEETRNLTPDRIRTDGRFYVFPCWMFPLVFYQDVGLFWNSASFQELEPHVVRNYLDYVNLSSTFVYLYECMDNSYDWGVKYQSRSVHGVLDRVWYKHYQEGLRDFRCVDRVVHCFPYCHSFWIRRG